MRIQHNILAMNAYRNYNNNTAALGKNLEKLSSGYKINRAGDDAAGLAISEKMRAQITGLSAASKNVKDGISLVKTAEGAMQEIQDMLNRMDYLATQSANGTYDNEVDRANLQKEVDALKEEINRIADSANFNGIKLLDGSLDKKGSKGITSNVELLPEGVGQTLGTDTVLHKDIDDGTEAISFSVDLHNLSFKATDDNTKLTIEIGNNAFTYTAEAGATLSADDIAKAFANGEFKADGAAMTAGKATFTDKDGKTANFTVENAGNGRITFTQDGTSEFNPDMEVTIHKGEKTADALVQGKSIGAFASRVGSAPTPRGGEEPATVTGALNTAAVNGGGAPATPAVYTSTVTVTTAPVAGNEITVGGTKYTVVADSATVSGNQVKAGDVADAGKMASWIASTGKLDTDDYKVTANGSNLVYTAKYPGAVGEADGNNGPDAAAAAPTAEEFKIEAGTDQTGTTGSITIGTTYTEAEGKAEVGGSNAIAFKQGNDTEVNDTGNANLIAAIDAGYEKYNEGLDETKQKALNSSAVNLTIKVFDKAGEEGEDPTPTIGLFADGDVLVAEGTVDTANKNKITFSDSTGNTILAATFTALEADTVSASDFAGNTIETGITVTNNGSATAVGVDSLKTDQKIDHKDATTAQYTVDVDVGQALAVGDTFKLGGEDGTTYTIVADSATSVGANDIKVSAIDTTAKFATWLASKVNDDYSNHTVTAEGSKLVFTATNAGVDSNKDDLNTLPEITVTAATVKTTGAVTFDAATQTTPGAEEVAGDPTKTFTITEAKTDNLATAAETQEAEDSSAITIKNVDGTLKLYAGEKEIGTGTVDGTTVTFKDSGGTELMTATLSSGAAAADFTSPINTGLTYVAAKEGTPDPTKPEIPEGFEEVTVDPPEDANPGVSSVTFGVATDAKAPTGDITMKVENATAASGGGETTFGEGLTAKEVSITTGVEDSSLNGMKIEFKVGDNGSTGAVYDQSKNTVTVTLGKDGGTTSDGKFTEADLQALLRNTGGDTLPGNASLSGLTLTSTTPSRDANDVVINVGEMNPNDVVGTVTIENGASSQDKIVTVKAGETTVGSQVVSAADWAASEAGTKTLNISVDDGNTAIAFTMNVQEMKADNKWDGTSELVLAKVGDNEEPSAASGITGDYNKSTTAINKKVDGGGDRLASTAFNLTSAMVKDGASISIAGTKYTFTTDAKKGSEDNYVFIGEDGKADLSTVAERLTNAAKANAVYTVGHDGSRVTLTETDTHGGLVKGGVQASYPPDEWDLSTLDGIKNSLKYSTASGKGEPLTLQIGDTSDSFNQMKLSVGDMHTSAMGTAGGKSIADIDISNQEGAQEAVQVIKDAINYVSSVRGDLGATQNRLEHTQNNLSVMSENIQDAESTIRDTDVAEEMMSYVKNNILVQSAQAMLAQANQVPQGVLQLLG